jgi:hypothetical protein
MIHRGDAGFAKLDRVESGDIGSRLSATPAFPCSGAINTEREAIYHPHPH